ncbi:MAG TPA: hypothetical protein VFF69_12040 [Phycisphaerales bacterium]|nr:hypothetical protein [Phycisphaerales bacterium]
MARVITAIFPTAHEAAEAARALTAAGVPVSEISIVGSDNMDREAFGVQSHSKLPEGAAMGAGFGGAVGALVAGLTSIGVIATGGIGLLAAGPVIAALAGAGAGAAGGSVLGGLVGWAIPEHEVKHYEDALKEGSVLLGVECPDRQRERVVKEIFDTFETTKVSHA